MIVAPANRMNGQEGGRLLTWLRQLGVKKIYDVSLGADICIWGHIRMIERDKPKSIITQPCPAIVNYIQHYEHGLLKYLSPIHSPMLCTAIYMNKYDHFSDSLAALSPCIAKSDEFAETGYVEYNVTLKKIFAYIRDHNIQLPAQTSGFDHPDSALGRLFPMPGGLRENIEFIMGKDLSIFKAEGYSIYSKLDAYSDTSPELLPKVFDVLNCIEGCNIGPASSPDRNIFEVEKTMDVKRKSVANNGIMDI
jgi:hypothetical protein